MAQPKPLTYTAAGKHEQQQSPELTAEPGSGEHEKKRPESIKRGKGAGSMDIHNPKPGLRSSRSSRFAKDGDTSA